MNNPAANNSHIPCLSWAGQNGWSTASIQESLFTPLSGSQLHSLDLFSGQRLSLDHLQASNQSRMIDMSASLSTHQSALFKASHSSSASVFANTAFPRSSHSISFVQQNPHTLPNANQGKNIPPLSLPHTNHVPQPCGPQQLPPLSSNIPYKTVLQDPLANRGISNRQDQPISLPSCGRRGFHTSQITSGEASVEFASQEQCQCILSSQCRARLSL